MDAAMRERAKWLGLTEQEAERLLGWKRRYLDEQRRAPDVGLVLSHEDLERLRFFRWSRIGSEA